MASLIKSYSVQLKRKPNSHTKLPKIDQGQIKTRDHQLQQQRRGNKTLINATFQPNILQDIKKASTNLSVRKQSSRNATLQNEKNQQSLKNNKSIIKLKPIRRQKSQKMQSSQFQISQKKQKINVQLAGSNSANQTKTDSAMSSRTSLHPVVNQIQNLISDQAKKFLLPVKSYNQNQLGQVVAIWWCVTDSIFVSLQKILKVKQTQPAQISPQKQSKSPQKSPQKTKGQKQPQGKAQKKKQAQKSKKTLSGIVQSNTKISLELSKAYCNLQQQNKRNDQIILRYYEDPNHITLILEAMFYEKAVIYLLGTIRKWNHQDQLLYIHSMAIDMIPCVIQCRKLMIDILMEAVENEQHDNKIRKPKYIARQKKLIQISKFTTMIKSQYQKYINSLGSPHRYKVFQYPQSLKEYSIVQNLQNRWKNFVFDVPLYPYIPEKQHKKQFLIVIQPLNILYKYNKKQQSLQLDPYVQIFLKQINRLFDVVFFTCMDKDSSLINFLGTLDKAELLGVLDKDYLSFREAKPIKDLSKIGAGYSKQKILVIDEKNNAKYYNGCKHSVFLIDGNHTEMKIARVNGKLVRLDDQDEDYLKNLGNKVISCAERGGNWEEIIIQKNQYKNDSKLDHRNDNKK